jgi:hypothetical protein
MSGVGAIAGEPWFAAAMFVGLCQAGGERLVRYLMRQQSVESSQEEAREYHRPAGAKCSELTIANPLAIGRFPRRSKRHN